MRSSPHHALGSGFTPTLELFLRLALKHARATAVECVQMDHGVETFALLCVCVCEGGGLLTASAVALCEGSYLNVPAN